MEVLMGPALRIGRVQRGHEDPAIDDEESSDSSIGEPGDSDEEEERDEDQEDGNSSSSEKGKLMKGSGSLGNLASLEDSLPMKRGLSLHVSGKSKSFTNLAEANIESVKDLEKTEHPFNKKRRMLRWSRNSFSGYYKFSNPRSMPVLPFIEDEDDYDEYEDEEKVSGMDPISPGSIQRQRHRVLKSRSCFALADLPEEEDDDD